MTVIYVGQMNTPNYMIDSTDVELDGTVDGVVRKGSTVYIRDTAIWKIVKDDLTLEDWALPISFNGSVDIGAVHLDQNLTESIEISPVSGEKAVTVSGTAEPLVGVNTYAISMLVQPKVGNVGNVYFGDSGVDKTTSKQIIISNTSGGISVDAPVGYKINLFDYYIDADNPGDGVRYTYFS